MSKHDLWSISYRFWKKLVKLPRINRIKANILVKKAFVPIGYKVNSFTNVAGDPFDGDLIYWSKRNSKYYDGLTSKILRDNNYRCHYCNHYFIANDKIELHHVDYTIITFAPRKWGSGVVG